MKMVHAFALVALYLLVLVVLYIAVVSFIMKENNRLMDFQRQQLVTQQEHLNELQQKDFEQLKELRKEATASGRPYVK